MTASAGDKRSLGFDWNVTSLTPPFASKTIFEDLNLHVRERETVVKALGDGRFQPVDVVVGAHSNGKVEILSGLNEGDEIVTSGQFLIDSESSLQASFQRMSGE